MNARRGTPIERFWPKVDRSAGPDECWPWTAFVNQDGYGTFSIEGRSKGAHRVSFFLTRGHWPQVARHTCDNSGCCNPGHILDGTYADNMRDKMERGIGPKGIPWAHHCQNGHEMTPENTYYRPSGRSRTCIICRNSSKRVRRRLATLANAS